MIKRWLVMDIGCIECGVPTYVVGTYDTENEAKAVSEACGGVSYNGQHSVEVFDLHAPQDEAHTRRITNYKGN